jgi:hypothetical protein
MNEGTRSGKCTIRLLGISAERPTNGLCLLPYLPFTVRYGLSSYITQIHFVFGRLNFIGRREKYVKEYSAKMAGWYVTGGTEDVW